ncbi:hypothetical protein L195_g032954 [Trifolium pratense]|uniref:Putative plant transposon protein domain-containing protein n=1 Tax=Trifolium pratense TaxID=57577 RepID=A0A2K3LEP5_TRIPR|nr:hypothetical protein L195_g032954 [Trifolium pratense]
MSSMLTRLTGKGKKNDNTPPQEPPKKKRLIWLGYKKGQSSSSSQVPPESSPQAAVLRPANSSQPLIDNRFLSDVHQQRYFKIRTFTINQEKGFGEDLLKGVAELGDSLKARKWVKFNKLMMKDEENPGNQLWVREFLANAYDPAKPEYPAYVSVVRGVRVNFSAEAINTLLGCRIRAACEFLPEKARIDVGNLAVREELKNIICWPGARWLPHSATSFPTRLSLTTFNPVHRAWGEFWLKNVRVVGNSSEIQADNVGAVRFLAEGRFIGLGLWLSKDLYEMANNSNQTFTLGHCNLISALCRARNVTVAAHDGDLHPIRPLSLSYFTKKFERGPMVYRGDGNAGRDEAAREEEEINRFEDGVHPDQHGVPISHYSGLPNMYYDTSSLMYSEAMSYRSTFPPPTFGTLYPVDTEWEAHQAREMASFQARQSYNSSLRTSELAEMERRRRVEQEEVAAMEREMLDVDGLNLNLNHSFTDYFSAQPDDES